MFVISGVQSRGMVRWEAVIVALLGGLLGLMVGLIFGVVTVSAAPDVEALSVSIGRIVLFFVLAGVAGVLAAILPARRAARLDLLEAVSQE